MAGEKYTVKKIILRAATEGIAGLRDVSKNLAMINRNAKTLSSSMSGLTTVFRGWLAYVGVRQLARFSDDMLNLTNRLKIFAGSSEAAADAFEQIQGVAIRTKQSINDVGVAYNRIAVSLKNVGITTEEVSALTESLINSFRIAGASVTETSNTMIQLSQAFASGELRGQELRSIMEQNATMALLLRKRFGPDLYKDAEKGLITIYEVMKVIVENQREINTQAKELTITFEQIGILVANRLSVIMKDLNDRFKITNRFAAIVTFVMDNLASVIAVAAVGSIFLMVAAIEKLITAFGALKIATLANPWTAAFTAIGMVVGLIIANADRVALFFKRMRLGIYEAIQALDEWLQKFRVGRSFEKNMERMESRVKKIAEFRKEIADEESRLAKSSTELYLDEMQRYLESAMEKARQLDRRPKGDQSQIRALNLYFEEGAISASQYATALDSIRMKELTDDFREGKIDAFKFNDEMAKFDVTRFQRALNHGDISIREFNESVAEIKIKHLNEQFAAGLIDLKKYNEELIKLDDRFRPGSAFQSGVESYIESVGNLSQGIAKGIEQTFTHLEDNLAEFVKTGTFNFNKFAQAVLDDLTKIIIRASIVRPLAEAMLTGYAGSGAGGTGGGISTPTQAPLLMSAKGNAFDKMSNVIPFAKGGIVDSPTAFGYGRGRMGVMGEAGPEAIIPLKRSSNGDLGVKASVTPVTVNIINQSGAEIQQSEHTGPDGSRQLDILITGKVREGLLTGKYDTAMKASYGVTRRGS